MNTNYLQLVCFINNIKHQPTKSIIKGHNSDGCTSVTYVFMTTHTILSSLSHVIYPSMEVYTYIGTLA